MCLRFVLLLLTTTACARLAPIECDELPSLPHDVQAMPSPLRAADLRHHGHSHNDYASGEPLTLALAQRFGSVEADVWSSVNGPLVGHTRDALVGPLQELYLAPLAAEIARNGGSVYGDGEVFTLWIDIKDSSPLLREQLLSVLADLPFLTRYTPEGIVPGAVEVIVTGDWEAKNALVEATPHGRAFSVDRGEPDAISRPVEGPMDAVRAYGLDWYRVLEWTGDGDPSREDLRRVECLSRRAAGEGRKLRFYNAPDFQSAWRLQLQQGVSFVGTDRVAELGRFLARQGRAQE